MKNTQIEYLRKKEKMSQEQLADKLEISRQTISEWERGITYPSVEKLLELSNIFNVSLDFLIKGIHPTIKTSNQDNFLHYSKFKNTKGYIVGKQQNELIASIPENKYTGNTLVIGGCGSGKTRGYLIPNLLKAIEREESIILIDHLNEIQETIKEDLLKAQYNINTFDFMNPENSSQLNILEELTVNNKVSDKYLDVIYKSLFSNIENYEHYILFNLLLKEKIENKNFNILNPEKEDIEKILNKKEDSIESKYFKTTKIHNTIFKLLYELNQFFYDDKINNILINGNIKLENLIKPKTITFINPNFFDNKSSNLLCIILNILFSKIILKDIKIDNKINVFLDEYGNLSENFNLINNLSYLNQNINISILIQSLSQLNNNYDKILNNFRNFIYMGSFNMKDIEILSEFFNLPINELKDLKEKLVYKREFENAIFLNKLLTIN